MAQSLIDIRIRALIEGLAQLDQLRGGLGGAGAGANELGAALGKVGGPLGFLKDNIGTLVTAFTALVAAYGLKESADYAARTQVLGTTLGVVAKNAGYGTDEIAKYETEVRKMGITTQATRQALTQMIQAGLEIGPAAGKQVSQVALLARAAQDLAVVTGENSSATLSRLITNIAQMDSEGLRYMGLTVNIQQAQEKFAVSIGKTVGQLDQQQKVQAVTNEALDQATKLTGAYEASMGDVGKQIQSLKRYQEDLADTVGARLLPAYFNLVQVATNFLKTTNDTIAASDKGGEGMRALADGTKVFFEGLSDLFSTVIKIGADIYPTIEIVAGVFMELTGEILHGIGALLQLGDETDAQGNKVSALGTAIKDTVIIPIGLLIAGLKDGFLFLGAAVAELAGEVMDLSGVMLESLGKIVRYFNKDFGDSIIATAKGLKDAGADMKGFARDTFQGFSDGNTAVNKFNKSLSESKDSLKATGAGTIYDGVEKSILAIISAQRKKEKTDIETTAASKELQATIDRLGTTVDETTGKLILSEKETAKLGLQLKGATKESINDFIKSLSELGLKLVTLGDKKYLVPVSKEFDTVSSELLKLSGNANTTGIVFQQSFAKGVETAKTLTDLDTLKIALNNAKVGGIETGDSLSLLTGKFESIFAAQLKVATTKNEFELLAAQVTKVGEKGDIAGKLVAKAMDDIKEKASGARQEALLLARNLTETGQANLAIGNARLGVAQADYSVGKSRLDVWKAQNAYNKDGTDLNREELRLAQISLEVARSKALEARVAYSEAQQSAKVILATQEQILAVIRLQRHPDDADLILAKDAADKKLEAEQKVFETVKQQAQKQQEITIKLEEQKFIQQERVDKESALAEYYKQSAGSVSSMATSSGVLSTNVASASSALSSGAGYADKLSTGLSSSANAAGKLSDNLRGANAEQLKLKSAIDAVTNAQQRLDEANGTGAGTGGALRGQGRLGGDSNFKDEGDFLKNGKAGDTFKNPDGTEVSKDASGNAASTATRPGMSISAEENRYYDFTRGKGKLTEADKGFVKAKLDAAKANKDMYDKNTGAYSNNGAQSITEEYNRAMRAAQSLGIMEDGAAGLKEDGDTSVGGFGGGGGLGGFAKMSKRVQNSVPQSSNAGGVSLPSGAIPSSSSSPSKVVQVNFTNDAGKKVPTMVDANDEGALLELLKKARGTSA